MLVVLRQGGLCGLPVSNGHSLGLLNFFFFFFPFSNVVRCGTCHSICDYFIMLIVLHLNKIGQLFLHFVFPSA